MVGRATHILRGAVKAPGLRAPADQRIESSRRDWQIAKRQCYVRASSTSSPMPNDAGLPSPEGWNFANLLHRAAERFGERPALMHRGRTTSFSALQRRAAAISAFLRKSGLTGGDVCAIHLREPEDAAAAFFGALAVGATAINVNELLRPRQIEYILANSRCRVLLTSRDLVAAQPRALVSDATTTFVEDTPPSDAPYEPVATAAGDRAQITYTSGSTGLAKGVAMSNANLWAGVR